MSDQQIRFSYNLGADLIEVARDELGCFCLVICPKPCQTQWIEEIETAYKLVSRVLSRASVTSRSTDRLPPKLFTLEDLYHDSARA